MSAESNPVSSWLNRGTIKGFVLDIDGVLYTGNSAISGSIEAFKKLRENQIPIRLCTNTSTLSKKVLAGKLHKLGFQVEPSELFPPPPAMRQILIERKLRPLFIVDPAVLEDFADVDQTDPNCVVLGDATDGFSYQNINKAFQLLMRQEKPLLFSMGQGKYYKEPEGLMLDSGPFMKALEYACDTEAEVVGKPSKAFFSAPVKDMGLSPTEVVMIGDDINFDIKGGQNAGMRAIQVRTGKYRPSDEPHPNVKPNAYVDNLAQAVDIYLKT